MTDWRACRDCGIYTTPAKHCGRCRKCKKRKTRMRPPVWTGCCRCPSDRRPTGTKHRVAGIVICGGEPDGTPVPIPEDPYGD